MSQATRNPRGALHAPLPVLGDGPAATASVAPRLPVLGCPACSAQPGPPDTEVASAHSQQTIRRLAFATFFAMNVMVFTIALWSQDLYTQAEDLTGLAGSLRGLFRYLAMLFALPVLYLLGGPILAGVGQALRRRTITTDLLIMLGVLAAYAYSVSTVIRGAGHIYFEVGCMVLIFVTLGRWLEARGKQQAIYSLDALAKLLPERVRRIRDGVTEEISRQEVARGDVLRILPGERFAIDGTIFVGCAEIDEQILTGESTTITKTIGDPVYSGTRNIDGDLCVEVTAAAGRETVSRLLEVVRRARECKGNHARLADRVAAWFVPLVCLVAAAATLWHWRASGIDVGLLSGLAVVLIACPCALGLATPMAIWAALGRAAREQVLFRSGQSLEDLAAIDAVRFDKTGTLTSGAAVVAEFLVDETSDDEAVLRVAAALAAASSHSFSDAISRDLGGMTDTPELLVTKTCPGKGITAQQLESGTVMALGSRRLMEEVGLAVEPGLKRKIQEAGAADASLAYVGWDSRVRGVFVFHEELRTDADSALAKCAQLGLNVAVLTGDHQARAKEIERYLQIPVFAELLPADKVAALAAAREKHGRVAMVGDGLNDAPALAAADVGVALGCGADLSRDAADVCLLSDHLDRFSWAVALARRTVWVIRENLFWAFAYNVAGIGLAVTGRLNPIWAALAMALSSGLVVTNSLRLSRFVDQDLHPSPTATT